MEDKEEGEEEEGVIEEESRQTLKRKRVSGSPTQSPPHAPKHQEIYPVIELETGEISPPSAINYSTPLANNTPPSNATSPPQVSSVSTSSGVVPRKFFGCSPIEDYELLKKIGEGTFGEVSTAKHKVSGNIVALKKILMHNEKEGIPITALREIKILKYMTHENIVPLLEMAVRSSDRHANIKASIYMVFPYMDHDLDGLLKNPNVRFTIPQIKSYMQQLLRAADYLHKENILHRDMKCANILIDNKGNLKLADFGLARSYNLDNREQNYTNLVVTRWYRPPELLLGATKYTTAVDLWGVGCVFGEILLRTPIFPGNDDIDQLDRIFQLCGSPSNETWPQHKNLPAFQMMDMKMVYKNSLKDKFSKFQHSAVDLLSKILQVTPNKRLSAEKSLLHEWFTNSPYPAKPGSSAFSNFPTSHELDARNMRHEAEESRKNHNYSNIPVLPNHYGYDDERRDDKRRDDKYYDDSRDRSRDRSYLNGKRERSYSTSKRG